MYLEDEQQRRTTKKTKYFVVEIEKFPFNLSFFVRCCRLAKKRRKNMLKIVFLSIAIYIFYEITSLDS